MNNVKILIANGHPIVREGIKAIIFEELNYQIVGETGNGRETVDKVVELKPDIVIIGIVMTGMNGILTTQHIKKSSPHTKILIISMYKEKEVALHAFRAGADGYLVKENAAKELLNALLFLKNGNRYICPIMAECLAEEFIQQDMIESKDPFDSLSLREKEILELIVDGKTNKEIANNLFISITTVKTHRYSLMKKLDVHDAASLTKIVLQKRFI